MIPTRVLPKVAARVLETSEVAMTPAATVEELPFKNLRRVELGMKVLLG